MLNTVGIEDYLTEVRNFADKVGKRENLETCLERLDGFFDTDRDGAATCYLGKDFAPYSFSFYLARNEKVILNGGVIFHGQHDNGGDGSAPTYSVSLSPQDGWSIHT